jgi:hypothetical protein
MNMSTLLQETIHQSAAGARNVDFVSMTLNVDCELITSLRQQSTKDRKELPG